MDSAEKLPLNHTHLALAVNLTPELNCRRSLSSCQRCSSYDFRKGGVARTCGLVNRDSDRDHVVTLGELLLIFCKLLNTPTVLTAGIPSDTSTVNTQTGVNADQGPTCGPKKNIDLLTRLFTEFLRANSKLLWCVGWNNLLTASKTLLTSFSIVIECFASRLIDAIIDLSEIKVK
ncbi:hypothetical protein K439DRAFT_1618240 [Ramaria rubella]|nr:hypothetical protein K439DRAFT_1618240 [Ramaria rubella]